MPAWRCGAQESIAPLSVGPTKAPAIPSGVVGKRQSVAARLCMRLEIRTRRLWAGLTLTSIASLLRECWGVRYCRQRLSITSTAT